VSFYPNKHITTGEGGMILTDNDELADQCRELRNLCFKSGNRFVHERLGWNLRMTNLQAALGVAQLERLDEFVIKKRWVGQRYNELLAGLPGLQLPLAQTDYADNIYWVYGLVLDDSVEWDAKAIMGHLNKLCVGCRPFFFPMHQQPVLREMGLFEGESYPVAERMYQRGFYVPSGLALKEDQIFRVSEVIRQLMNKRVT
jgi:perosamine synthetase